MAVPTLDVTDKDGIAKTVNTLAGANAIKANANTVGLATDEPLIGIVTETAPASDTASSGLNGRLQRIAQRITSLMGLLPTALGAGGGLKVDGSGTALPVSLTSVPSHAVTNAGTFAVQPSAAFNSTPPTVSNGATSPLQCDANGFLKINMAAGGGAFGSAGTPGSDVMTVQGAAGMTPVSTTVSAGTAMIGHVGGVEYETVAASATAQALGATGATGDYIAGVLVIPATTSPGAVTLLDNATSITIFTGGASSVSNLVPFFIPLGIKSVSGAWKLTTGANVSCIGVGDFT